jgi:hypothetical protein
VRPTARLGLFISAQNSLLPSFRAIATGLQQLEANHKRSFANMMQRGFNTGNSSSSSSSQRITTADQLAAYDATWMHDSSPRQHVMQRVADRDASEGRPHSSAAVIHRFRAALQQQLTHDWMRSQGDIRLNSGVPLSWLRGRNPVLPPALSWNHHTPPPC